MGVYVPNAKAPSACIWCTYPIWLSCDARDTYTDKRPTDCPLVEVKPHGRLIDADALHIDLMDRGIEDIQTNDWYEIQQAVDDAPTIIESEEEDG